MRHPRRFRQNGVMAQLYNPRNNRILYQINRSVETLGDMMRDSRCKASSSEGARPACACPIKRNTMPKPDGVSRPLFSLSAICQIYSTCQKQLSAGQQNLSNYAKGAGASCSLYQIGRIATHVPSPESPVTTSSFQKMERQLRR